MENIFIKVKVDDKELIELNKHLDGLSDAQKEALANTVKMNRGLNEQSAQLAKAEKAADELAQAVKAGGDARQYEKLKREIDELKNALRNATAASRALKTPDMSPGLNKSTGSANSLGSSLKSLGALAVAVGAAGMLWNWGEKIAEITKETEKHRAVLTNSLGSMEAAGQAMAQIEEFASKTPFSVQSLTESYVKLVNSGIVPTTEQLRQLGDLASATGKDMDQLVEALLDAKTGEFERLKEFGVKAAVAGDKVTFSFKGVQTTVNNTGSSIEKYILSLGDLQGVAGGMAAISDTLGGKTSNLGDAWDSLSKTIGAFISGPAQSVIGWITNGISYLDDLINGVNRTGEAFLKSKDSVAQTAVNMSNLAARYDELSGKTNRSAAENEELKKVTDLIAKQLPEAATEFDQYGNAIELSTAKVRELIKEQKELARANQIEAYNEETDAINELLGQRQELINSLKFAEKARDSYKASGQEDLTAQNRKELKESIALLNEEIKKRREYQDVLTGRGKPKGKTALETAADRINAKDSAPKANAQAIKQAEEDQKAAAKQLRKLNQELLIDAQKTELDKQRLRIKFDRENTELELKQTAYTAELKKQLKAKEVFELSEVEKKAKIAENQKLLESTISLSETATENEKLLIQRKAAEKIVTEQQAQDALAALELEGLSQREAAYNAYLAIIDQSTENGKAEFEKTQKEITAINKREEELRIKGIEDSANRQKEMLEKQERERRALLELRLKYAGAGDKAGLREQIGQAESDKAETPTAAADVKIDAEKEVLDFRIAAAREAFGIDEALRKTDIERIKAYYDEIERLTIESYDKRIAEAQKAGLETKGLEEEKQAALKQNQAEENVAIFSSFKQNLAAAQNYAQQATAAYTSLANARAETELKQLAEEGRAAQKRAADADKAIGVTKARLQNASGTQKKELEKQLATEESAKKRALRDQEENERKQEKIRVEAARKAKVIKLSLAVIDTAQAVTSALSEIPKFDGGITAFAVAAAVAAMGAANIASIAAQPLAKGTLNVKGGTPGKDSVPALLMPGESVMPVKTTNDYRPTLEAMYNNKIDPKLLNDFVAGRFQMPSQIVDLQTENKALLKTIESLAAKVNALANMEINTAQINMDAEGFSTYLQRGSTKTKLLNKGQI